MKVLYLSHLREESGYGRWCKSFLRALKTTDLEISSFTIPLGKASGYPDETESVSLSNIDVCIQNTLPHFMSKGRVPCIGGAILETATKEINVWGEYLQLMDEVWYPHFELNLFNKEREIPCPINIDKAFDDYPKISIDECDGTYKFYWIGELSKRKNLRGLIQSYYSEFSYSDPVSLIIKCHDSNFDSNLTRKKVEELVKTVANGMKLYPKLEDYPKIIIISDFWPKEKLIALHKYCDCYVSSSHGESINFPMLDALLFNKNIISTTSFATESYMKYGKIELVPSEYSEICFGQTETFQFYQSSRERWQKFNNDLFCAKMRKMYETRPKENNDLSKLSYNNIGKLIKESLCEVC